VKNHRSQGGRRWRSIGISFALLSLLIASWRAWIHDYSPWTIVAAAFTLLVLLRIFAWILTGSDARHDSQDS
jgi:hypothetical protein